MPPRDEDETVTHASVSVTLPADANQIDDTGNVWLDQLAGNPRQTYV
jgi:hypothetical protein